VLQQIGNTLAMRKVVPRGADRFELQWTYFGYADDTPVLRAQRVKQANMIGPAGLISMEDGEATQLVQANVHHSRDRDTVLAMGGLGPLQTEEHLVSETAIRAMWQGYCKLMDYAVPGNG
jgi:anthranilate 1,2-dioxygenase large subunit